MSLIEWPGKMTAILFLGKCNFRCPFCHNKDLVVNPNALPDLAFEEILEELRERGKWIDAIELTGGEPTLHPEIGKLAETIKKNDFLVKLDTNGSYPEIVRELVNKKLVDYIAMDIKNSLEKYNKTAGVKVNLDKIKESIRLIMESGIDYEFRTTVVPGLHTPEDMRKIGELIRGAKRFFIQNFEPRNTVSPEFENKPNFSKAELEEFKKILKEYVKEVGVR